MQSDLCHHYAHFVISFRLFYSLKYLHFFTSFKHNFHASPFLKIRTPHFEAYKYLLEGNLIYVLVMADRKLVRYCLWITCFMDPRSIEHNSLCSLTECSLKAFFLFCCLRNPLSAGENNSSLSETLDHRKPRGAQSSITSMTREEQSQAKFRPWRDFKIPLFSPNSPPPKENWRPLGAHLPLKCHTSLISSYSY